MKKAFAVAVALLAAEAVVILAGHTPWYQSASGWDYWPSGAIGPLLLVAVAPLVGLVSLGTACGVARLLGRLAGGHGGCLINVFAGFLAPLAGLLVWWGALAALHALMDAQSSLIPTDVATRLWIHDGGGMVGPVLMVLAPATALVGAAVARYQESDAPQ